jgi:hypothetical protein
LASLPSFKQALQERFGFLPVLNEVDMILVGEQGQFDAIEAKCFTVDGGSFSRPFYDGIGQSLSLMRYGFDHVALWHLFSGDIDQRRLDRYGASTWWFLRNQTGLPLEFTYFKVRGYPSDPQFVVMQYEGPSTGAELLPIDSSHFRITWKHPNPFKETQDGQYLRAALADALGIGDIVDQ